MIVRHEGKPPGSVKMTSLEQYLDHLLELAHRRVGADLSRVLARSGLQRDEWRVLEAMADENGRSMGELAQLVSMNHPTLTKLIDRMVAKSWVQRNVDPHDSRRVLVFITDVGLQTASGLHDSVQAHRQSIDQVLGERKSRQLRSMLATLIDEIADPPARPKSRSANAGQT